MPKQQFGIILADPPWEYDVGMKRGGMDNHYATMNVQELAALEIPSGDSCILFLWATMPKLPEALEVMKSWGFTYRTGAVWVKDKIGTGYYFRSTDSSTLPPKPGLLGSVTPLHAGYRS